MLRHAEALWANMLKPATIIFGCLAECLFLAHARAENWNQFRGPESNGVVQEAKLPLEWGPDKQIVWKVALPGVGWSQPIVWGDKIFVTTAESDQPKPNAKNKGPGLAGYAELITAGGVKLPPPSVTYKWKVMCLDAGTGETIWEKVAHEGRPSMTIHANNTYASETPVSDGERVIAYFGMTGIYCYDLAGNQLWKRDLGTHRMQFGWGTGSSPMLYGDCVYVQCDNDEKSFLVAIDKKTGQDVWRVDRDEKSNWATPYIWHNKLRTELVTAGGKQMRSYDPNSGELLWSINGSGRTATTPVGNAELLFVDSYDRLTGLGGNLLAVRPGGSGDISLPAKQANGDYVAWSVPIKGGRMASPALCQEFLYFVEQGGGFVRCLDAKTGVEYFRKRLPEAAGLTSSPIVVGDKIYCTDQNCKTFVLQAGKELQVVATNDLGEFCWSSAAIAGDKLLMRTVDHLFAVGEK